MDNMNFFLIFQSAKCDLRKVIELILFAFEVDLITISLFLYFFFCKVNMGLFISLSSFFSFFIYFFICLSIYYFVMPGFHLRIETSDKEREGIQRYIKTQ